VTSPTIDGSTNWGGSGVAGYTSPTLTTTKTNDIIVVCCQGEMVPPAARSISSVTATGLTFAKRASMTATSSGFGTNCQASAEIWWALATSTFSGTITATWSAAMDGTSFTAFGVNGCNTASPWDTNGSLDAQQSNVVNSGATPSIASLNVNDANALAIAFFATFRNNLPTTASGWTNVNGYTNSSNGISLWSMNRVDCKAAPGANFTGQMSGSEVGFQFMVDALRTPLVAVKRRLIIGPVT
jgi:hypothetical protein